MPRFTIGIPTYNRADLLRETLESALAQTYPDVEILVCDNASGDRTAEVVESYGDRIRYHRNATNIGMYPNFAKAIELASGEYFSLLQDDDLIHCDFVRRAVEAFERAGDIVFYSGFGLWSPSQFSVWVERVLGPPFPVDWMGGKSRVIDGIAAAPLLHFTNFSTYPLIAFRTDTARRAARHLLTDCELFNENVLMACTLAEGKMAIDPWICAFHRIHSQQAGTIMQRDQVEQRRQWRLLAGFFEEFLARLPDHWRNSFREALKEIPVHNYTNILVWASECAGDWWTTPAATRELRDFMIESAPEDMRGEIPQWITAAPPPMTPIRRLKREIKRAIPPKVVRIIEAIRG
jgi:glycosyltransferase involved in cell wall biosynthesis